jgi:hypothetical protein
MPPLTTLRNWAHSAAAIVGWLSLAFGIVQTSTASLTAGSPRFGQWLAAVGAGIVLLSKLIDSANNALGGTPSPPAPPGV